MKPSTYKALQLLRNNESVTTADFLIGGCGSRFGARLAELRHDHGCIIEEHKLSDRSGSRYRLIFEPSPAPSSTPGKPVPISATTPAPRPVGASGQVKPSNTRCAVDDDWDWEDAA